MHFIQRFWYHLENNYPKWAYQVIFPFTSLLLTYIVPTLFFYVLERFLSGKIKQWKIQPKKQNSDEQNWKAVKELAKIYFFVIFPLYTVFFSFFVGFLGFGMTAEEIPGLWIIFCQLVFCWWMEDLMHYIFHRLLHTEWGYRNIHYKHHEFSSPSALHASYAHPAEVIILGIATFSGPILLSPHLVVLFIWVHIRELAAIETHCGYEFPFSLSKWTVFGHQIFGGADFHDYHHRIINGAYASNHLHWDIMFGTAKGYFEHKKKMERRKNRSSS